MEEMQHWEWRGEIGKCCALRTGVFQEVRGKPAGGDNGSLGSKRRKAGKQGMTGREEEELELGEQEEEGRKAGLDWERAGRLAHTDKAAGDTK